MFKLRLLTAAAAATLLAGAATAQTSPQTSPPSEVGQPTSDAAAKAAKDQAMKGTMPSDSAQTSPSAQPTQPMAGGQSDQATTQQQASAQQAGPGTSKEGMSESTTRAWVEMDLEETTVGNSRLFVGTITDSEGDQMTIVTNGPVPDNATNRAEFPPLSAAGRRTAPRGN